MSGALLALTLAPAASAVSPVVSPNVQVNTRGATQGTEDFKSPAVAINPDDPNDIVTVSRNDVPDFGCQIHHSSNGGATWTSSTYPPPSRGSCWSPAVSFGGSNRVYVATQDRPIGGGGTSDIIVWSSSDGGSTFGAPITIPGSNNAGAGSRAFQAGITVDNQPASPHRGRVYAVWYTGFPAFTSVRVFLSYSDDQGATWSIPTSKPDPDLEQFHPTPTVGPDGTVYVVYKKEDPDGIQCPSFGFGMDPGPEVLRECPIRVLRSSNGGQSFDLDTQVAPAHFNDRALGEAPGIVTTPSGAVLAIFASLGDLPTPAGCTRNLDIVVARSTDRGATWSAPRRVNDDPCGGGASQRDSGISVAPNGRVDAIFYDNRNDPSHVLYDAFYASSSDDGQTFGPNVRISDRGFDLTRMFAPRPGFVFQPPDYDQVNGIASTNAGAVAAWGDTRNAPAPDSTVSDVFSARIELPIPAGPSPQPPTDTVAPGVSGPTTDTVAPGVSDYGLTNNPFRVGGRTPTFGSAAAKKKKRHKKGTTFRYTLSEAATARIVISQRRSGRRRAKRCVAPTRKLRKARKCTRITTKGTLTRTSHKGANRVGFSGRIGSKVLKPGRYQATLTATDAARNASRPRTIFFTIVKR